MIVSLFMLSSFLLRDWLYVVVASRDLGGFVRPPPDSFRRLWVNAKGGGALSDASPSVEFGMAAV